MSNPATILVQATSVVLGLRPGDIAEVSEEDYRDYANDLIPIERDPFAAPAVEAAPEPESKPKPSKPKPEGDAPA